MSPNKDETRSQSVTRIAVNGRVFSLVLMYDKEIISALLIITNTLILVGSKKKRVQLKMKKLSTQN